MDLDTIPGDAVQPARAVKFTRAKVLLIEARVPGGTLDAPLTLAREGAQVEFAAGDVYSGEEFERLYEAVHADCVERLIAQGWRRDHIVVGFEWRKPQA